MKKPNESQIIQDLNQAQDQGFNIGENSWGSYTKQDKWGTGEVLTGKAVREFIQQELVAGVEVDNEVEETLEHYDWTPVKTKITFKNSNGEEMSSFFVQTLKGTALTPVTIQFKKSWGDTNTSFYQMIVYEKDIITFSGSTITIKHPDGNVETYTPTSFELSAGAGFEFTGWSTQIGGTLLSSSKTITAEPTSLTYYINRKQLTSTVTMYSSDERDIFDCINSDLEGFYGNFTITLTNDDWIEEPIRFNVLYHCIPSEQDNLAFYTKSFGASGESELRLTAPVIYYDNENQRYNITKDLKNLIIKYNNI